MRMSRRLFCLSNSFVSVSTSETGSEHKKKQFSRHGKRLGQEKRLLYRAGLFVLALPFALRLRG